MVEQVRNTLTSKQTINPKTVLGFYATILGILFTATVATVGTLATTKTETQLILPLLLFAGGVLILLLVGVFVVTLFDPSKLMLTQVSGSEYAAIQEKLILGDSSAGERVVITGSPLVTTASSSSLPSDTSATEAPTDTTTDDAAEGKNE